MAEAKGELFAFLSADDLFEPRYVEELWRALERCRRRVRVLPARCSARAKARCAACPFSAYFLVKRTNFVNACALTRRPDYLDAGG